MAPDPLSAAPSQHTELEPAPDFVLVRGDWPALVQLFAHASPVSMSHWQPQTGETFQVRPGNAAKRAAQGAAFEQRLWHEEQWVEIPCQESDVAFVQLQTFVAALRPGKAKAQLTVIVQAPKPFRHFRQRVAKWPGVARRWQSVVDAEAALRLAQFCLAQGWRLADPRFDDAVVQWLDATDEPETAATPIVAPSPVVRVKLAAVSLALARRAGQLAEA